MVIYIYLNKKGTQDGSVWTAEPPTSMLSRWDIYTLAQSLYVCFDLFGFFSFYFCFLHAVENAVLSLHIYVELLEINSTNFVSAPPTSDVSMASAKEGLRARVNRKAAPQIQKTPYPYSTGPKNPCSRQITAEAQ